MKKTTTKINLLLIMALFIFCLAGCKNKTTNTPMPTISIPSVDSTKEPPIPTVFYPPSQEVNTTSANPSTDTNSTSSEPSSSPATAEPGTVAPPIETAPVAPPSVSVPPITPPTSGNLLDSYKPGHTLDFNHLATVSNAPTNFGFSTTQRDEFNRPNGCTYYHNLYNKYNADFYKENINTIYLTFDEGYEFGLTPTILDTLKEKNVKAVFFVTMPFAKKEPGLISRMINEGHVVGSHSVTHPANGMPNLTIDQQINEMVQLHNYIYDNYGYEMYLFRYPAGIFSEQSLSIIQGLGYRSVFWSFAHKDWITAEQPPEDVALDRVVSQLHNGAIYLLHAVSQTNTNILGRFIDEAHARGFTFGYYSR